MNFETKLFFHVLCVISITKLLLRAAERESRRVCVRWISNETEKNGVATNEKKYMYRKRNETKHTTRLKSMCYFCVCVVAKEHVSSAANFRFAQWKYTTSITLTIFQPNYNYISWRAVT